MQVEGELFQVHGYIFERESDTARGVLARRSERPDGIVVIEDLTAAEFERFLTAVYCKYVLSLVLSVAV
jgi:hypothetical protein